MAVIKKESLSLTEGFESGARKSDGTVWNIFVQILLPLVIILSFVAVITILKYKDVAGIEKAGREKALAAYNKIVNSTDPESDLAIERENHNFTKIQLQRMRLLKALDEVEMEKRRELKLGLFPGAGRINLQGINVIDPDFKELCTKAKNIYDNDGEQTFKDDIYSKVIQKADIRDTQQRGRRVRWWRDIPKDDPIIAKLSVITPGNRANIHNEIIEFATNLKKEIKILQIQLLQRLFRELIKHPETLDEKTERRLKKIISTKDENERRRRANEFYQRIIRKWRNKLDKEGYMFLEDSWDKLRALS